jgi:hypothetical protein
MDGDDGASAVLFAMDGDFGPRNGLFQPPSQTSAQVREKGRLERVATLKGPITPLKL